ncbi:FAD/NAD(P)-binding domain-containing protein [Dichomitus squalens]|uniref:FAD/NAD(P)-binding domain-containing protein n=1 Tax=Dichomitus squalens TaxID=114155 RepID=A0A4Q9Q5L8_9APHY|nr:FAD/NAD(P)-binding domain-containing protein [Dichomitus squalens]
MDFLPTLEASWNQKTQQHICIIGSGPSGLAALKIIRDSQQFKGGLWTATAFEARDKVGGIWLPAPPTSNPPSTPLYDSLTTNLPHPVMAYTSFPFPAGTTLFPPASTVLKYFEDYAAHFELNEHIRLNTPVLSITRDHTAGKWTVSVRAPKTSAEETHDFDYVIVANGHYRLPRLPATPGLGEWVEAKRAVHSVYCRNPSTFGDAKTVLVVGGGPSGQDLVTDLLASGRNIVHSVTGAAPENLHDGRLKVRGRIAQYGDLDKGLVTFEDGSEESGIDKAVLATGYKFDFPFFPTSVLRPSIPPPVPPLPGALYNSTYHIFPLARHVFPLVGADEFPSSTVAFLGIPIRVAPLPLLEAQMRAVLHVFEHPESLDPTQEAIDIISRYETLRARVAQQRASSSPTQFPDGVDGPISGPSEDPVELAIAAAWHRFEEHEQFQYRDAMHAFAEYPHRVPAWEIEMYDAKGILREEWRDLERLGQAEEWVRGVGAGEGEKVAEEWVDLMRKLLRRAEERHPERSRL